MLEKIKHKYKEFKIRKYLHFNWLVIKYKYIDLSKESFLVDYIEKKALELAKNEGVEVYNISFAEMNKGLDLDDPKCAAGKFVSLKEGASCYTLKFRNRINKNILSVEPNNIPRELVFPRIELSEEGGVFVLLHELGHYFIYKNKEKQSEELADKYSEEFFGEYLPPFFKWVFQIDLFVRAETERNFTLRDGYDHFEEYKKFKNNHDTNK